MTLTRLHHYFASARTHKKSRQDARRVARAVPPHRRTDAAIHNTTQVRNPSRESWIAGGAALRRKNGERPLLATLCPFWFSFVFTPFSVVVIVGGKVLRALACAAQRRALCRRALDAAPRSEWRAPIGGAPHKQNTSPLPRRQKPVPRGTPWWVWRGGWGRGSCTSDRSVRWRLPSRVSMHIRSLSHTRLTRAHVTAVPLSSPVPPPQFIGAHLLTCLSQGDRELKNGKITTKNMSATRGAVAAARAVVLCACALTQAQAQTWDATYAFTVNNATIGYATDNHELVLVRRVVHFWPKHQSLITLTRAVRST